MKVLYIAPRDFPRRVANRVQTMEMAQGFAAHADTTLCISKSYLSIPNLFRYYGVSEAFTIKQTGHVPFGSQSLYALIPSLWQIVSTRPDVVFFREEQIGWLLSWFIKDFIYEMHSYDDRLARYYPRLVSRSKATTVVSQGLKDAGVRAGLDDAKLHVHPAGVDVADFDIGITKASARAHLGIDVRDRLVMYAGRLNRAKGVEVLVEATRFLPEGFHVLFIGGFEGEPEALQEFARGSGLERRVTIAGAKPHSEIPLCLAAADVLVAPNVPISAEWSDYTSPLKLFEFMAARRPVVASDIPAIREILDESSATLVPPGNAESLAQGIVHAANGGPSVDAATLRAFAIAEGRSWVARAGDILRDAGFDI